MTKKENFNAIANILNEMGNHDFDEFIAHEVELLNKKKTSTKPTKRQVENETIRERIFEVLGEEGMTPTEIMKALGDENLNVQRISANLTRMTNDKIVIHETVKGKSLYRLA
jgi:hypothetical protein